MTNTSRRILIVTQYFWPEEFRINELARELSVLDFDVDVLTCQPSYPGGRVFSEYRKNPRAYESFEGINVYRAWSFPRGKSHLEMALAFFSFPLMAYLFGLFKLRKNKYDVIFAFQPSPVFSIIPALLLSPIWRAPVIAWVQDLWPDILVGLGRVSSKLPVKLLNVVSNAIYKRCDSILVTSKGFKTQLESRGLCGDHIFYFPQWVERAFNAQSVATPLDDIVDDDQYRDHFKIVFTGNIGECQDFESVISAFSQLTDLANVVLLVVGEGRALKQAQLLVDEKGLGEKIVFLGRFPVEYMKSFFEFADALLLPLASDPAFENTIPGKTQSYLSSGKLVLGMVSGETNTVLAESGAAILTGAGNYRGLADNIRTAANMSPEERLKKGQAGQRYCEEEFSLETALAKVRLIIDGHRK